MEENLSKNKNKKKVLIEERDVLTYIYLVGINTVHQFIREKHQQIASCLQRHDGKIHHYHYYQRIIPSIWGHN